MLARNPQPVVRVQNPVDLRARNSGKRIGIHTLVCIVGCFRRVRRNVLFVDTHFVVAGARIAYRIGKLYQHPFNDDNSLFEKARSAFDNRHVSWLCSPSS